MTDYLIYAWDGHDEQALNRRLSARADHFHGARVLKAGGHFITGGAILNDSGTMIGSMMVVRFETRRELDDWLAVEPYMINGVWQKLEINPFRFADV